MIAYKLLNKRKDGTYGPLFINRKQKLLLSEWYPAEDHPTKGYAHRPGWHCCEKPIAPHLSEKNRVWCEVDIENYEVIHRPESQGNIWFIAKHMMIVGEL